MFCDLYEPELVNVTQSDINQNQQHHTETESCQTMFTNLR